MSKKLLLGLLLSVGLQGLNAADAQPTARQELQEARKHFEKTLGGAAFTYCAFKNTSQNAALAVYHGLFLAPTAVMRRGTTAVGNTGRNIIGKVTGAFSNAAETVARYPALTVAAVAGSILAGYGLTRVPQEILKQVAGYAALVAAGMAATEVRHYLKRQA